MREADAFSMTRGATAGTKEVVEAGQGPDYDMPNISN